MASHDPDLPCAVAATYGLHPVAAEELPGGWVNDSWRVRCDEGEFVVRRYGRLDVTRSEVLTEHAIMARAAARLEEVRAPLVGRDGSTLQERGGRLFAVLPYIQGTTGDRDPPARTGAAQLLARFHKAMDDHPCHPERSAEGAKSRDSDSLAWLRKRFAEFSRNKLLATKLDWNAAIAVTAAAASRLESDLPQTIVHGDVQPANVVAKGGEIVGLIDFDFAHRGERAYDVAVGMNEFGRAANDAPLDLGVAAAFAAAYAAASPLTPAEREALADLMICRDAMLVWYIVTEHGRRAPGDTGNAAVFIERIREVERLREELLGRVA